MHRFLSFRRLGILFLGLFGMIVTGLLVYQQVWVSPGRRQLVRCDHPDLRPADLRP